MREFNIFGPVYPELHYHIDRVAVKAELRELIARGRYLTLNASRQTGKTTLFSEVIAEAEASGEYFSILLDFESLVALPSHYFYEELGRLLARWRENIQPAAPDPTMIRHHIDFVRWLRECVTKLGKKGVLIIDEFDAISPEIIEPILSLFRGMYLERRLPPYDCVHSIILVGVRNLPALLKGTQSPFNIADQFTVPYFTPNEVADLLTQHTAETGQPFASEVIEGIVRESEGQPFLVNRLGKMLTQEIVTDFRQPITSKALDEALARLVNENNSHFASITSKAMPHRKMLLPMLFYNQSRSNLREAVTSELLMYGVLRAVESESGAKLARIANPIYRRVLILTFAPTLDYMLDDATIRHQHIANGTLNFDALLDHFKAFMREHGVRLLKSAKTGRPLEISGQYLLLSYLEAALNSVQGYVAIESVSSAGEIDILAFYRGQRFIVETKIWYDNSKYEEGKKQLLRYLQAAGLDKGYMLIFAERPDENPISKEAGEVVEITIGEKLLRIYWIGVKVEGDSVKAKKRLKKGANSQD